MLPVIALIGRPNVGKSTLFNRLTRSRDALVADYPGLTRDRQYGFGKLGPIPYLALDTCGVAGGEDGVEEVMVEQTILALQEADVAIIMMDGRTGLTPADQHVAELARRHAKRTWLAINKSEGLDEAITNSEFHALGLGDPIAISSAHGGRLAARMEALLSESGPTCLAPGGVGGSPLQAPRASVAARTATEKRRTLIPAPGLNLQYCVREGATPTGVSTATKLMCFLGWERPHGK